MTTAGTARVHDFGISVDGSATGEGQGPGGGRGADYAVDRHGIGAEIMGRGTSGPQRGPWSATSRPPTSSTSATSNHSPAVPTTVTRRAA